MAKNKSKWNHPQIQPNEHYIGNVHLEVLKFLDEIGIKYRLVDKLYNSLCLPIENQYMVCPMIDDESIGLYNIYYSYMWSMINGNVKQQNEYWDILSKIKIAKNGYVYYECDDGTKLSC